MKYSTLLGILLLAFAANAQIPAGYYQGSENLSGSELRLFLHERIDNHQVLSYSSLWTHFQQTDKKSNGKVWDMYSDIPGGTSPYEFSFGSDQCGNYSQESDCYNREHSWPQSWFNSQSPMSSDLFHLFPTDGYVNGKRANYPFGQVGNANWTSQNGSKVGDCIYPGYNGIVFEPIDEYKGDFARTYFYMATRYYTEDSNWNNTDMANGADLKLWAKNMLIEWHVHDPVSDKEINRNEAVYILQQNRNPFIDFPEFAHLIFADDYPAPAIDPFTTDTAYENLYYELLITGTDPQGFEVLFEAIEIPAWLIFNSPGQGSILLTGMPSAADYGNHLVSIEYRNQYSQPELLEFELFVDIITQVDGASKPKAVKLFPNPAKDWVRLEGLDYNIKSSIRLFTPEGKIYSRQADNFHRINLSGLPVGSYFLEYSIENKSFTKPLIVH